MSLSGKEASILSRQPIPESRTNRKLCRARSRLRGSGGLPGLDGARCTVVAIAHILDYYERYKTILSLMRWNWQQPDWPKFTWEKSRLAQAEQQFLLGAGTLVGSVKHLAGDEREQITIEAISTEAVTTSEIEGEILDRASVQSSIRRTARWRDQES